MMAVSADLSMVNWNKRISHPHFVATLVWMAIFLCILVSSSVTILKHKAFETTAFDLGNMDQAVWNSIYGRFLPFTNWGEEGTRLAYHVDPILILISPPYLICSDPRTLLVLQTVIVALGAWPIYLLARERLGTNLATLAFPLAYLLFPALEAANMFDFHPTTLVAAFLPYAFLSLFGLQVLFLSLPTLAIILLSGHPQGYILEEFHYALPLCANPIDLESP